MDSFGRSLERVSNHYYDMTKVWLTKEGTDWEACDDKKKEVHVRDMIRRIRKYRTHKNAVKKKKNYIQKIQIPLEINLVLMDS